ncbi:MAG: hypothetical protein R2847_04635 [Bacteroidia bacterium]
MVIPTYVSSHTNVTVVTNPVQEVMVILCNAYFHLQAQTTVRLYLRFLIVVRGSQRADYLDYVYIRR